MAVTVAGLAGCGGGPGAGRAATPGAPPPIVGAAADVPSGPVVAGATAASGASASSGAAASPGASASSGAATASGVAASPGAATASRAATASGVATPATTVVAAGGGLPQVAATAWGADLPAGALPAPTQRNAPVRLRVPAVGVDAPVVPAGVLPGGALDLPADTSTVAWYAGGPVPGESGSAVLAAHVDYDGAEGVFFELARLAPGSAIEVVLADGTSTRFRTAGPAQIHPKRSLPLEQVFRRGAAPQLTLITCGGTFDTATGSYEDNVVVTAAPLPPA